MKYIIKFCLSLLFLGLIFAGLLTSLEISAKEIIMSKIDWQIMFIDFLYSFIRVTCAAFIAWIAAIVIGKLLHFSYWLKSITLPALNFIRHISPYAWLPIAIIWFGLGETPAAAILLTALFFPAVIMTTEIYEQVQKEYKEEARINGASDMQVFLLVELPLLKVEFINLFRILWGLGWTTVIAVEMLGVKQGLGFRLLDFRYLLQYENMVIYLLLMGSSGILIDHLLLKSIKAGNEH
jgi:NitT/TauT family transport system permease protein